MSIDYLNPPPELLDQPIESWQPSIGDRVRVRLNGECVFSEAPDAIWQDMGFPTRHFAGENGRTGFIREIDSSEAEDNDWNRTHRYVVQFDAPMLLEFLLPYVSSTKDARGAAAGFAANELEPLDGHP